MKIINHLSGSAGRLWTNVFELTDGCFYKRISDEFLETLPSRTAKWKCGGVKGEGFWDVPKNEAMQLEEAYCLWLKRQGKEEDNSRRKLRLWFW